MVIANLLHSSHAMHNFKPVFVYYSKEFLIFIYTNYSYNTI